jgi:hypothetical protein
MHRTLHEFEWFVTVVIWGWSFSDVVRMGEDRKSRDYNEQFWIDQMKEYERIHKRWKDVYRCSENDLINEARAFLEYCQGEYGEENDTI